MARYIEQSINHYHIARLLEQRATNDVYLARPYNQETTVTIQMFHSTLEDESARERFRQEIEPLTHLKHPHLLSLSDYGEQEHIPYLVTTPVPESTLRQRYPSGSRVALSAILADMGQVASALHYLHEHKYVHRNVCLENIWSDAKGTIFLGLPELVSLTITAQFQEQRDLVHMIAYLAPEQRRGRPEPASDQYSLAAIIYELLSGHPPFQGSFIEVMQQQESVSPPPLDVSLGLHPAIEAVLARALSKDPAARFPSMLSFIDALYDAAEGKMPQTQTAPSAIAPSDNQWLSQTDMRSPDLRSEGGAIQTPHHPVSPIGKVVGTSPSERPMVLPLVRGPFQRRDILIVGIICVTLLLLQALAFLILYNGFDAFVTSANNLTISDDLEGFARNMSSILALFAGSLLAFQFITSILVFPTLYLAGPLFGAWRGAIINLIYSIGFVLEFLVVFLQINALNQHVTDSIDNITTGTIKLYYKVSLPPQLFIPLGISFLGAIIFAFVLGKVYERRKRRSLLASWGIYTLAIFALILWSNITYALATPLLGKITQSVGIDAIGKMPWLSFIIVPPLLVGLEALIQSFVLKRQRRQQSAIQIIRRSETHD